MIKLTNVETLKSWLDKGEAVLVDVREPAEWAQGHIEGATLIPLATVDAEKLPPHAGKKLVLQCKLGGRSHTACSMLISDMGDADIYNLEGGIVAWAAAGLPLVV